MTARGTSKSTAIAAFGIAGLLASGGCGLALDEEQRLARAAAALHEGEYRAAVIDARNVLIGEPENAEARLVLGKAAYAVGDFATAAKELARAIDLGVPASAVLVELGDALIAEGRAAEAIEMLDAHAGAAAADTAAIHRVRGDALLALSRPEFARAAYHSALRIDSDDLGSQLGVAASYSAEENHAQARQTLDEIVALNPDSARAWLASARLHLELRNFGDARANLERALSSARRQDEKGMEFHALSGLVDVLLAEGEVDAARESLEQLDGLAPDAAETRLLAAKIAWLDGDIPGAQRLLQSLLNDNPDYPPALKLLGAVQLRDGKPSQAEVYLAAAAARMPNDAELRRLLAEARRQLDKLDEARAALEPLLSESVADVRSLKMAARLSVEQGDTDAAADFLERSLLAEPQNTSLKLDAALAFISLGRLDRAESVLQTIDDGMGDDTLRRDVMRVLSHVKAARLDDARRLASSLLKSHPRNADLHFLLGSIELQAANYATARAHFEEGGRYSNNALLTHRNFAAIDEAEGNHEGAAARYRRVLDLEPGAVWAMLALARLAYEKEDDAAVESWLEKARRTDRRALQPRKLLARLYLADGRHASAETVIEEALSLAPNDAELHYLLGRSRLARGSASESVASFERAVELDPSRPAHAASLASALDRAGRPASARALLESAQAGRSELDIPTTVMQVSMRVRDGDMTSAKTLAKRLVEAHPGESVPHALLAELYAASGDYVAASDSYDRALAIKPSKQHTARAFQVRLAAGRDDSAEPLVRFLEREPEDTDIRLLLAGARARAGEQTAAIREYERVLQLDPDNVVALNNLAWAYYEANDDRALDLARRAYGLKPDHNAIADTLGWILVNRGELEQGIDMLERAVALGKPSAEIRYHLASALVAAGREDEARAMLEELLATDESFSARDDAEALLAGI